MKPPLFCDIETFSPVPIKAGTWAYSEKAEVMLWQYAVGDGPVDVWDLTTGAPMPSALAAGLADPEVMTVWHNGGMFDLVVLLLTMGIDLPLSRVHDTLARALAHGLPGALGKLGVILGLPDDQQKDKRGKDLIRLFCQPRPKGHALTRATRETHVKEWSEFVEYARQDIPPLREIYRLLPCWNYTGFEHELWALDQRINRRGIAVDLDLARAAVAATDREKIRLKAETVEATDGLVSSPSKRDDLLAFILAEHGVDLPDMRADTLRRRAEDPELPDPVKLLISIRLEATKTSTAKYQALLASASSDGRLRGTMQFCGASRTGRWAHRLFQPGNMPRPDMKQADIDEGIEALKAGCADLFFADTMSLCANAVRGAIVAPPGKKLVIADLANIEGRGLAFLAGEHWKLQAFREYDAGTGPDLYVAAYARSFGVKHSAVGKNERQIGKVQELGLGYEGGVAAFITFAAVYRMDLEELADAVHRSADKGSLAAGYSMYEWAEKKKRTLGLPRSVYVACEVLKRAWRDAHPATTALWKAASDGVKSAIANPGVTFDIGQHLKARRDGAWLRIRLPSGRYLCYLQPKVEDDQISYQGVNQYTRQWGRIKTYGGKLIENCTQAFARDVMAHNMPHIDGATWVHKPGPDRVNEDTGELEGSVGVWELRDDESGYLICLSVHDELITETPDEPQYNADDLAARMSVVPPWAKGLPLAAAGFETYRYRKE